MFSSNLSNYYDTIIMVNNMTREEISKKIQSEIFNEENKDKRKKLVLRILKILVIIFILGIIFILYTSYISNTWIIVNEKRIVNKKIPDSFNGTKIIHFSDLHYGTTFKMKEVKKLVKLVNDRKPDLILFTGDLIDDHYALKAKEQEELIKELDKMDASMGKYAITGEEDGVNYNTIISQGGFTLLNNDHDLIYKNDNNPILINGLNSTLSGLGDIDKTLSYYKEENHNSNIYSISMMHEPDNVDDFVNINNSDLYFAGHSHLGEVRLPFVGTVIGKEGYKKYKNDYYVVHGSPLYISSGLGIDGKFRLFARPSINFIRLSNK